MSFFDNPASEMNYSTESVIMKNNSNDVIPGASNVITIHEEPQEVSKDKKLKIIKEKFSYWGEINQKICLSNNRSKAQKEV